MDRWIGAILSRVHALSLPSCFTPREGLTRSHFIDEAARAILILKSHFQEPDRALAGSLARALDLEVAVLRNELIGDGGQIEPHRLIAMSTIGPLLSFAGSAATLLNKWDAATTRIHSLLAWDPAAATTTDPGKLADLIGLHLQILEGKVSAGVEARAGLRHLLDAALEAIDGGDLEGAVALLGDADAYDPGEPDDGLDGDARVRRIAEDIAHAPAAARESSSIVDDLAALMRLYLAHTGATPTITDLVRVCRVGLEAEARVAGGGGGEGPVEVPLLQVEPIDERGRFVAAATPAATDLERAANLEDFRERMIYADKNRPRGLDIGDPRRDGILVRIEHAAAQCFGAAATPRHEVAAVCLSPEEGDAFLAAMEVIGGGVILGTAGITEACRQSVEPGALHGDQYSGAVVWLDLRRGVVVGGKSLGMFAGTLIVRGQE